MPLMNDPVSRPEANKPDLSRRRLAQGGLALPVVLATLASKPVLGAAPYNCTISGALSGNTSSHGQEQTCSSLGRSPGYWKTHETVWPSIDPNAAFKSVFADAYWWIPQNANAVELCPTQYVNCTPDPTLLQVLNSTAGMRPNLNYPALGRAAVASLLNAYEFAPDYPLTPSQVIAMFNAVYLGGTYPINPTTSWSASQVMIYFESLYGTL